MEAKRLNTVSFDPVLIRRYGGRGPRYTSYPTALQFAPGFTERDYRTAVAASGDGPLSLYVHIPFCHSLCYYCGCNKVVTRSGERVNRYLDALRAEIRMQGALFSENRIAEQLHLGGGTPTYLDQRQIADLMTWLATNFELERGEDREFSIEVDPRSADARSIEHLAALGFNRVSLGVQDFDPVVQQAVNRIQSVEEVQALVDAARASGMRSVSFDLIYGLPHQNVAAFDRTLDSVVKMRPDRLAVYNYAHLPDRFKGQRMIREDELPAAEEKLYIMGHAITRLTEAGYDYIGMDHFALPEDELSLARRDGTLQRNFQGYSTRRGCDLVALGVSAISKIGVSFAQNAASTIDYEAMIDAGHLPVCRGLVSDADDRLRAAVIHDIMCRDGIDFASFDAQHDIDFVDYFAPELARLQPAIEDDLVTLDEDTLAVTAKGRLLLRSIAMVFDRYLDAASNSERFSKAI